MITIAIGGQKGGTGKTTSALTIGALLAEYGRRVLLVDLDPQASLTQWLNIKADGRSLAEVMGGGEPGKLGLAEVIQTHKPGLDIIPATIALAENELGMVQRLGREVILKRALADITANYDVCLIDCPPALSLLTINALVAARGVIAPVTPAALDIRGLKLFLDSMTKVSDSLNPELQLVGVIMVQFDNRFLGHQAAWDLLESVKLPLLHPPIPKSVKVQESTSSGRPLIYYDPGGKPSRAYDLLTRKVIQWLEKQK